MTDGAVLEMRAVEGFYGESQVLHGIDLAVPRGEMVTLIGRNGAGKTTTLRAIMGILRKRRGSVRVMGAETGALPPETGGAARRRLCPGRARHFRQPHRHREFDAAAACWHRAA